MYLSSFVHATTLMGKTAGIVIQIMSIDTLHEKGKQRRVIAEKPDCLQSAASRCINGKLRGR